MEKIDRKRAETDLLDYEVGLREETAKRFIRPFHHKEGSSALDFLMHRSGEKRTGLYPREIYGSFVEEMELAGAVDEDAKREVMAKYTRRLMQGGMKRDEALKRLMDRWRRYQEEEGE